MDEIYGSRVISRYFLIVVGFGFGCYAFYRSLSDPSAFNMAGMVVGFMLCFMQADRNVYRDRLDNMFEALTDLDSSIEVNRFDYVEYEIVLGNRTGKSQLDDEEEDTEETDQKRLDQVES